MLRSAINHYYQGEFEKKKDIADILLCEPTCLHITSGRVCVCVSVCAYYQQACQTLGLSLGLVSTGKH